MEKEAVLKLCEARGEKASRADVCEATLMSFMRSHLKSKGVTQCKSIANGGFGCTFSGTYEGNQVVCKLFLSGDRCRKKAADREMAALEKITGLSPGDGKEYVVSLIAKIPGDSDVKTVAILPFYEMSMYEAIKNDKNR